MWICLTDAFLSIVQPSPAAERGAGVPPGETLLVRARAKGDLERVFPGCTVTETPDRDYRFRAFIARGRVADTIANRIEAIVHTNFKAAVKEKDRHDAYAECWGAMMRFQQGRLRRAPAGRGGAARRGGRKDLHGLFRLRG